MSDKPRLPWGKWPPMPPRKPGAGLSQVFSKPGPTTPPPPHYGPLPEPSEPPTLKRAVIPEAEPEAAPAPAVEPPRPPEPKTLRCPQCHGHQQIRPPRLDDPSKTNLYAYVDCPLCSATGRVDAATMGKYLVDNPHSSAARQFIREHSKKT